jgi:hypothetical protein
VIEDRTRRDEETIHDAIKLRLDVILDPYVATAYDSHRSAHTHILDVLLHELYEFTPCVIALPQQFEQPQVRTFEFGAVRSSERCTLRKLIDLIENSEYPNGVFRIAKFL